MNTTHRTFTAPLLGLCLGGLFLGACGGGGSSGSGSSNGGFMLATLSVQPNATVQINRKIEFTFSKPVDFSSVNLNTISITQVGGGPAAGEFRVKMRKADPFDPCSGDVPVSNVIVFQPACPTAADYSDAGLAPGGVQYQINVVGSEAGGPTVRSTSGDSLSSSQTLNFNTPASTQPEVLFVDPVVTGAPRALIADMDPTCATNSKASYIELSNDVDQHVQFVQRPVPDASLGADVSQAGFLAPLNFYSSVASRVTIGLQIDQPVNPSAANLSTTNVRLQYLVDETQPNLAASWANVPHSVALEQNCTDTGAIVRVTPTGILPQGRLVRIVLASSFADIVGNTGTIDSVVGSFRVSTATNPGTTTPGETGDAFTEEFVVGGTSQGSQEDTTATLGAPPANWGHDELEAAFNFGGTGGPPNGMFDYTVSATGSGTTVLNTTFQLITDDTHQFTEAVIDGQMDVRNLTIADNAILEIRGPKPCVIRASGTVTINGRINLKGGNNPGVNSYCSANVPAAGATGNAGGGRGGQGSYNTTQSTPAGERGFGPGNAPGGGGGGGEASVSFSPTTGGAAGGGGGAFAIDVPRATLTGTTWTLVPGCPEQTIIGLDAENGTEGSQLVPSANPLHAHAVGGSKGPRPFLDLNPTDPTLAALDDDTGSPFQAFFHLNDFWGTMRVGSPSSATLVTGELGAPWAGSGGGGGGDVVGSSSFPTVPFTACNNFKGSGGGGGAGSLTILCLGRIVFGPHGRIDANGGVGGGAENTSNNNRVAGGSGGGSGGHVILQSGGDIDFSACVQGTTTNNFNGTIAAPAAGIFARGGEGGASSIDGGITEVGGANYQNQEKPPTADLLISSVFPSDAYPATGTTPPIAPCAMTVASQGALNAVVGAPGTGLPGGSPPQGAQGQIRGVGGDGGPGLIQIHVSELTNIIPPTGANKLRNLLRPPPVGATQLNIDTPAGNGVPNFTGGWNLLLPIFGRNSKSQSKWIALGATSVPPTGTSPEPVNFFFAGTDPSTGFVNSASGTVPELPAILSGTIVTEPSLPYITADKRSIVFDASTVTDDVYLRNPALMSQFELKIVGSATSKFDIATGTYDSDAGTVRVTVTAGGLPLNGLTGTASVIPRFFRVKTDGTLDSLPSTSRIKIEFQAAPATSTGTPNTANPTPWATNVADLNASVNPANTSLRFFRFRIGFEIGVGQMDLSTQTSTPALEFLKVPFKF